MIPRWHILFGLAFSLLFWLVFPATDLAYIGLMFLSSFLMDFDHYMCAVMEIKSINLGKALNYYKKMQKVEESEARRGIFRKGHFHIFHTLEFHLLVLLLSLLWEGFFYIFLGMMFHSIVDFVWMTAKRRLYRREFFFVNWLRGYD